jgi:adenine-specific DNA-methyltransferase
MCDNQLSFDFKTFPTTRYQGSKRKVLPWLYENFKEIEFETALDAFGGSGSVSYLLKTMNKSVTFNDFLKFNYFIGKSIIENDCITLNEEDTLSLTNRIAFKENFIRNEFNDIYYLKEENEWLDNVALNIHNMNHYEGIELEFKKSIAFNALFQASLVKRPYNLFHRRNLYLRTADVKRGFGNKTTWDLSFIEHFKKFILEINKSIIKTDKNCSATNIDVFNYPKFSFDLVYLDPPYITLQGDNETSDYLKCYHFLEGLANYRQWPNLIDNSSKTKRIKESYLQNHFKSKLIKEKIEELFIKFKESKIIFSYKAGGKPSIDEITSLLKRYKKNVYTKSIPYIYALNKQNGNATLNREVLIIGL